MNDIIKIIQAFEDSNILLKGVGKTIKNEIKKQKSVSDLGILLSTLGASLMGNLLTGKGIIRAGYGNKKGKGTIRAGQGIKGKALITPHLLTNIEIRDYYENESKLNGVYSRDALPNATKNEAYVINLDEHADSGTYWIALYVKIMC